MTDKEVFENIYTENIKRTGAMELLEWLRRSDFFTAPASTRFHLSVEGGLVKHSIHVYQRLLSIFATEKQNRTGSGELSESEKESIAIVGLLHDVCKVYFYDVEMRNRKNDQGKWEKYPCYVVNERLPYGHGEKSAYIVSAFMRLKTYELMAIRWHMGFSDYTFKAGDRSVGNAFEKYPMAVLAHIADLEATYFDEVDDDVD